MRGNIIKVGNSSGIRIPKALLEETGLKGEVVLTVVGNTLVISPARAAREGWDQAFAAMAAAGDDVLPDAIDHSFDEGEWEWK